MGQTHGVFIDFCSQRVGTFGKPEVSPRRGSQKKTTRGEGTEKREMMIIMTIIIMETHI